jgi:general stress protein YciG
MPSKNQGGQQGNKGGREGSKNSERGFGAMDPEKQREIASEGGKASHEKGTGHEFTSEEAREAGRKGGEASRGGKNSRE